MRTIAAWTLLVVMAMPQHSRADIQSDRAAFMKEMIQRGIFSKYEKPARLCRAYTGPRWSALNYDQKSQFANVVLSYCYTADPGANILVLRDGQSGKDIGDYSTLTGRLKLH